MARSPRRVAARAVLVVAGALLCLFGPARLSGSVHDAGLDASLTTLGSAVVHADHAIAERPSMPVPSELTPIFGWCALLVLAGVLALWATMRVDTNRLAFTMLATPWRRRGPPSSLRN